MTFQNKSYPLNDKQSKIWLIGIKNASLIYSRGVNCTQSISYSSFFFHLDKGFKVVGSELCHRKLGQAFTYRSKWVKFWTLIIPLKKTRSVVWAINFYISVFKNILLLTNCGQSKIPSVHTYCMLCTGWFILNGIEGSKVFFKEIKIILNLYCFIVWLKRQKEPAT